MPQDELPKKFGIGKPEKVTDTDYNVYANNRLSSATSLASLSDDFVLFSHAALVLYSGLKFDPLTIYMQSEPNHSAPFIIKSESKFFNNLEDWDYLIVGLEKGAWGRVSRFLDMTTALSREKKFFSRPLKQVIDILDNFAMSHVSSLPDLMPLIPVTVYGVDSNIACLHFQPAKNPPFDVPTLIKDEPFKETVNLANSYFEKYPEFNKIDNLLRKGETHENHYTTPKASRSKIHVQ